MQMVEVDGKVVSQLCDEAGNLTSEQFVEAMRKQVSTISGETIQRLRLRMPVDLTFISSPAKIVWSFALQFSSSLISYFENPWQLQFYAERCLCHVMQRVTVIQNQKNLNASFWM